MSEDAGFLSRWSRRKSEAGKAAAVPAARPDSAVEKTPASPPATTTPDTDQSEPDVDLSTLPSLDSIGPQTDISVFLQRGVPASLSHAALRRAWSADPAIRDFVGLAENAWDFTAPETIPGFGPLLPGDDVKRMVGEIFNDRTKELLKPEAETKAKAAQPAENPAQLQQSNEPEQSAAAEGNLEGNVTSAEPPTISDATLLRRNINDAVPQQNFCETSRDESPAVTVNRRRHGGALPT